MAEKTVPELARDTLKQLAVRKLAPTPTNYQMVFNEIGGLHTEPPFPADQLRRIAQDLPAVTPGQQKQRGLLEYAVSQLNWEGVHSALVAYGAFRPRGNADESGFGPVMPADGGSPSGVPASSPSAPALTADFLEQIARLIEFARPALGSDDARFAEQTKDLLQVMRDPGADLVRVKQMLGTFGHRVSFAAEDQAEIKATLLHLLHLILENISELSVDDRWLKGHALGATRDILVLDVETAGGITGMGYLFLFRPGMKSIAACLEERSKSVV